MSKVTLTLPFPPSVNSLFGGGSKQQRFPSKKYKEWQKSCPELPKLGMMYVHANLGFYFPDARARDLDNHTKAVFDYLVKHGVIVDDCFEYLSKITIESCGIDRISPRVFVTLEEQPRPYNART